MELPTDVLPPALFELLDGRRIDPEAHVTPEMLALLDTFIDVGIPAGWMHDIMSNGDGMKTENLPTEILDIRAELGGRFEELETCLAKMTELANTGNHELDNDRREYQRNELRIMNIVIDSIRDRLDDPESTKLILVLRGAKFFEKLFSKLAGSTTEQEAKRIMLEKGDKEIGSPFIMGLASTDEPSPEEVERIKTLILPDDCLSTGMTQLAVLEGLLKKGYRPEKVVMLFTVGTTAGIDYVYEKFKDLLIEYELEAELILQCGGLCFKVNDKMYLVTKEDEFMVGDMGNWNKEVPELES